MEAILELLPLSVRLTTFFICVNLIITFQKVDWYTEYRFDI